MTSVLITRILLAFTFAAVSVFGVDGTKRVVIQK